MRNLPGREKWAGRSALFIVAMAIAVAAAGAVAFAQALQMDPPTMSPGPGAAVNVSWLPVAPVGSGPTTYTLTYDTVSPFASPSTVVTTATSVTIAGVDGLTYFAVIQADDGSGVLSTASAEAQQLADGVPPVSAFTIAPSSVAGANGWYTSAGASISIVDTGTGLNQFFVDGVDVSTSPGFLLGFPPPAPSSYLVPLVQGDHTYSFHGVDVAGNIESAKTAQVKLDSVAPTCTLSVSTSLPTSSPVSASITATDAFPGSGIDHVDYVFLPQGQTPGVSTTWTSVSGASASPSVPVGQFTLFARSVDLAGNVSAVQQADTNFLTTVFTITPSAGAGGSISPSSAVPVGQGASATFAIAPSTGFHIADVVVDLASVGATSSYTFTNVQADHTIAASFAINTYTLTYTAGANGSIVGSSTQTVSYNGSGTAVTATPSTGYHFVSWSDGVLTATRTDASVTANVSATANFAINTYTLTYTAGAGGTVSGTSPQTVSYNGSGTAVTAVPNSGFHFVSWSDGVLTATRTDASVTANVSATANFAADTFSLAPSAGPNGSISPATTQTVNSGATATFTITPATGYHVADVLVDGSSVGAVASYTFTNVTASHTIAATFAINSYTLTYAAGANGSIVGSSTQIVGYNGSGTAVTAAPNAGYHFVSWSDGVLTATRTDANVTATVSVSASFAINTYTITPSAGANGSISPATVLSVNSGAAATFTVTPATGYHVADVLVDGVSVGAVGSYTFTNVTASHTISASFAANPPSTFTITPSAGVGGSISPATAQVVASGSNATFTITPATGNHIASVLVDGVPVGSVSSYTFTNVTASHTISASFAPDSFSIVSSAGAHGTISPLGAQMIAAGADAGFVMTPDAGYRVSDVLVDGVSVGAVTSYTFHGVAAPHSISVTFANLPTYTITAVAGAHGTITPSGPQVVTTGSDVAFVIAAASGYRISSVVVDGVSVGAVSGYTFHAVAGDHTIVASFSPNLLSSSLSIYASATSVRHGARVSFHGTLSPRMPNGRPITFWVKRPGSSSWVRVSTRYTTLSRGAWSYTYRLSARGSYYFQARFGGYSNHAACVSRVLKVTSR